jgi:transketolase C-terminal domain/subunit
MKRIGLRDTFAESGPYPELLRKYGMDAAAIERAVLAGLAEHP